VNSRKVRGFHSHGGTLSYHPFVDEFSLNHPAIYWVPPWLKSKPLAPLSGASFPWYNGELGSVAGDEISWPPTSEMLLSWWGLNQPKIWRNR
jgi:hypothetical protein